MTVSLKAVGTLRRKRVALFLTTIIASGLATPALAQTGPQVPAPPVRSAIDGNGINLATGVPSFNDALVTVGNGQNGIEFSRVVTTSVVSGGTIPWSTSARQAINANGSTTFTVIRGGSSIIFTLSGSSYVNNSGSGETLTSSAGSYVFTDNDGTQIQYDALPFNQSANDGFYYYSTDVKVVARTITKPNGEVLTFAYKAQDFSRPGGPSGPRIVSYLRAQSLRSSFGYMIKFKYAADTSAGGPYDWTRLISATAINNAVDYCDPAADTCAAFSTTWPSLTFSSTPSGSSTVDTTTDSAGRLVRYTRDGSLRIVGIKRPSSAVDNTVISYAANGTVSSVTTDGRTWLYGFSHAGSTMTATITNPDSSQRVIISDTNVGLPTSVKDELNRTTAYTYDTSGRVTQTTYPEGNKVQYTYDGRGNVTLRRAISKTPGTPADIVTSSVFPSTCTNAKTCNNPTSSTDAKGNVIDFTYNATHGGLVTTTAPAATVGGIRPQVRYGYSQVQAYFKNSSGSIVASGQPLYMMSSVSTCQTTASCAGASDEVKATVDYGPQVAGTSNNLLPVGVSTGSGNGTLTATTSFSYDSVGNRLTVDGPLAGTADTTRTRYDAVRQVVGIIGPDPDGAGARPLIANRLTYNFDGQVTLSEIGNVTDQSDAAWAAFSSLQQVALTYDASGRTVKSELKSGGTTYAVSQMSYDNRGRLDCTAERMDPAQWTTQSVVCTPQTTGPNGPDRITKNIYDVASQVTQIQTALGTADASNEVTATFNANGTTATVKDGENNLTTYEYDGFDRLTKTRYPSATQGSGTSSATDYEQLTLDANGNVTQRRLRDSLLINYTYDNLNRMTLKDLPGTEPDVSMSYDLLSRLAQASQTGNVLGFTYDALSRNLTQSGPLGSVAHQYDLAGRRTRTTWPDAFYVTYDYDVPGNVTAIRENGAASGVGVLGTYAYDNLGRRTSLTRGNGAVTSYAFDLVSRLSSLTQDLAGTASDLTINGFTYNAASQIGALTRSNDSYAWNGHYNVNRNYTVNGLNQMTAAGATSLSYDGRGNLSASGTNAYTYSSENLLLTGPSSATLAYDPSLRLYQTAGGGVTSRFQYDGSDLIGEYNASNALQRRYVHGPGDDEPLVWYEGSGTTDRRWLHADERGSVVAVSDGSGAMLGINRYDEFGIPQAGNLGRFGYTGQTWLAEIGMNYYKARIYSPTLGRFMQTDPIGYGDGMNLYNYVGSDPVNGIDPSGLCGGGSSENGTKPIEVCGGYLDASLFPSIGNGTRGQDANGPRGAERRGNGDRPAKTKSLCDAPGQGGGGKTLRQRANIARLQAANGIAGGFLLGGPIGGLFGFTGALAYNANGLRAGGSLVSGPGAQGNRAFGAVASGLGIPLQAALRFAGFYEQYGRTSNAEYKSENGNFAGDAPYGDDPGAQEAIKEGYKCGKSG